MAHVAKPWLVVGGDGLIGRALTRHLADEGHGVLATTRRRGAAGPMRPFLELAQDPTEWALPSPVSVAFLLAASTNQLSCCADSGVSHRINVDHTVALARRLVGDGTFVVFTSTNLVFDGEAPRYPICASPSPTSEYGRQKAEAEQALLALGPLVAVVRLTKILSADMPLIGGWIAALRAGRPIDAFSDLICAPMPVGYVTQALARIGAARKGGLFHLSGADEVSYVGLAQALAARLGADRKLVRAMTSAAAGVALSTVPKHSSLDSQAVADAFALPPPSLDTVIESCLR